MFRTQQGSLWDMTGRARVISLIGAGGKTTSLECLAKEISGSGEPVLLTTTTKVYPLDGLASWLSLAASPPADCSYPCFWYAADDLKDGKWIGLSTETVDREIAAQQARNSVTRKWVIEGDGARGHKLKCWADYEPQIPLSSDCVVLILDSGLWGKTLNSGDVHRHECCADLIGRV
ncbi:MAG: selenium cofactor biosynthesis protein YqeC, partial [Desulfitobacteriaceae bacterium]